jgi:antitoxin ParD1/3/4
LACANLEKGGPHRAADKFPMDISLPEPVRQYVDEQIHSGRYASASEYFRDLVRRDQDGAAKEALEQTLLDAMKEGRAEEATPEWWAALRQEVTDRAARRRK